MLYVYAYAYYDALSDANYYVYGYAYAYAYAYESYYAYNYASDYTYYYVCNYASKYACDYANDNRYDRDTAGIAKRCNIYLCGARAWANAPKPTDCTYDYAYKVPSESGIGPGPAGQCRQGCPPTTQHTKTPKQKPN